MTDTRIVKAEEQPQAQQPMALVAIDPRVIAVAKQNLTIMEQMVKEVLEPDVDYGIIPGTQDNSLLDAGASTVANAFNTYPEHHILSQTVDHEGRMTLMVRVRLIHRVTKDIVAEGVGAASGLETKYAYRWLTPAQAAEYGIPTEALQALPKRHRTGRHGDFTIYKVGNPDPGELANTLLKMGAKRAAVDAANSLPGVKKALAKVTGREDTLGPTYGQFWGEVRRLGYSEGEARRICGVKSMKEWVAAEQTLEEAITRLREARQRQAAEPAESNAPVHVRSPHMGPQQTSQQPPPNPVSSVNAKVPKINTPEELVTWVKSVQHDPKEIRPALGLGPKAALTDTPQNMAYQLAELWGLTVPQEALAGQEEDPF